MKRLEPQQFSYWLNCHEAVRR